MTPRPIQAALGRFGFELMRTAELPYTRSGTGTLRLDHDPERLAALREAYRAGPREVVTRSLWSEDRVSEHTYIDEGRFRSESMYVWQYVNRAASSRERQAEFQYAIYLDYLRDRDTHGLLDLLAEDGAFGAPIFHFPGQNPVSRDVLDSVNEILYLDRQMGLMERTSLRVLDIGAGYGRLAHRMAQAVPGLTDYVCVDAIPESTYTCERYLGVRGVCPPCRVVDLPDVEREVTPGSFDLAINIHSFSEMPRAAIEFWIGLVQKAEIESLLIVPNAPTEIRSYEPDGTRHDMSGFLEDAGFTLEDMVPIIEDRAAREMYEVDDHFHFYRRK